MASVRFETDRCKGCSLCVISCPKEIIAIDENRLNKSGHPVAYCTDESQCTGCTGCAVMCPDCVITVER